MICKNLGTDNTIQNYLTLGKVPPVLFNDPNIGLTNLKVTKTSKGFLVCSFNREKSSSKFEIGESKYLDLNKSSYYLLAAIGSISQDNNNKEINKHLLTASSSDQINFLSPPITTQIVTVKNNNPNKVKSHGLYYIYLFF